MGREIQVIETIELSRVLLVVTMEVSLRLSQHPQASLDQAYIKNLQHLNKT
jgi:hypothetical protein